MGDSFEIGWFRVSLEGEEAVCRFAGRHDFSEEPPSGLPEAFEDELAPGGRLAGYRLVVALDDVPAVSSRQLGALLAVHRAAGGGGKLAIRGVRPNVRSLFDMTKMADFFEY